MMTEKQKAMDKIRRCAFAVDEARLFLDTHPMNKEAMEFYQKHLELYNKAVADFENRFAPVSASGAVRNGKWAWATTAWPWERSEN